MTFQWKWAAASVRGTGHAARGERRQDAYRVLTAGASFLVAVACDGAGSTSHGGRGAAVASRQLSMRAKGWIDKFDAMPTPSLLADWIDETREKIVHEAGADCTVGDYATTVVLAISNGSSTVTAHIGDGAVITRNAASGNWLDASWPHHGEYAATTYFLTDAEPCLRIGVIDGIAIDRLAVFSDGLERLALSFASRTAHAPFFDAVFRPLAAACDARGRDAELSRQLATLLSSASVNARTDDDKTLILATFE